MGVIAYNSNKTDRGITPKWFMKQLQDEFNFDMDVCPPNPICDYLNIDWAERNYCNPPYSKKKEWLLKAIEEQNKGKMTVFFLPVDTSTKWYHELVVPHAEVRFIKGRVKSDKGVPPVYASMLAIFHPKITVVQV